MKNGVLVVAGVLLLQFACGISMAQQAPGSAADANNPSGPPGPMQTTSIWKVDPLTGALTLTIPLTKPLGGGRGPHYGQTILYNSASTITLQNQGMNGNYAMFNWEGANQSTGSFAPNGPWVWNGPIIRTNASQIISDIQTQSGWIQGCTLTGPALYEDANGATHDLNVVYLTMNSTHLPYTGGTNSQCNYTNTTSSSTEDSSAVQSSLNLNTVSAIEPDGTSISGNSGTYLEDSNGNINNLQDSEGRSEQLGNVNCNPFVSATTCQYTAYGFGGTNLKYSISSQTITIGDFHMPHPQSTEIQTPFMAQSVQLNDDPKNTTVTGVYAITYPDTTSYQFGYTPNPQCANQVVYGTVTSITFPTGGNVEFCWSYRNIGQTASTTVSAESTLVVTDVYLSSGSGATSHWTYNYQDFTNDTLNSTETAPDGTITKYSANAGFIYSTVFTHGVAGTFQETSRDITDATYGHLRTISTIYSGSSYYGLPYQVTTTYWDVSPTQYQTVQYSYDTWGNVTEKDESGLYTGSPIPWIRKTLTSYAYSQPYCPQTGPSPSSCPTGTAATFNNAHIVNKPSQVIIEDGNGSPYSIVQYGYDESTLCSDPRQCVTAGALNHDDAQYGLSRQTGRGNLTSEARCATISNGTCGPTWLITEYTYDMTGQHITSKDPNGNVITFSYSDNFSAGKPGSEGTSFTYGTANSPTNSFLYKTTFANGAYDTYGYDYFSGDRTSHVGWNLGTPTTYSFDDMERPISVSNPDGGSTTICYTDEGGSNCTKGSAPFSVYTSTTASPSPTLNKNVLLDGLGRPSKDTAANGAETDTTYDLMGRVASVSNPYFSGPNGYVTYAYDGLGRVRYKCNQDNGTGSGPCVPGTSYERWLYSGSAVTFTDEDNNSWQRTSDGLGRLTQVVEPNGAKTYYTYDPLGNLTCAAQDGGSGGTYGCAAAPGSWRPRTFSYDAASRLLCASNPENSFAKCPLPATGSYVTGTVGYTYDPNSNVATKTDARGVLTSFSYDNMNRLLSKTYSNAPAGTLSSCYQYDSATNGKGHLASEWTQVGNCPSSPPGPTVYQSLRVIGQYDLMGRIESEWQCVAGYCSSGNIPSAPTANCTSLSGNSGLQYCYDEAGNLLAFSSGATTASAGSYPQAAMTFSQTFDSGGHLTTVVSSWNDSTHPSNLFTAQAYWPWDVLSTWFNGPHISVSRTPDIRLRVTGQTGAQQ